MGPWATLLSIPRFRVGHRSCTSTAAMKGLFSSDVVGSLRLFISSLGEGGSRAEIKVHDGATSKVLFSAQQSSWAEIDTPAHLSNTFFVPGQPLAPGSDTHLTSLWRPPLAWAGGLAAQTGGPSDHVG